MSTDSSFGMVDTKRLMEQVLSMSKVPKITMDAEGRRHVLVGESMVNLSRVRQMILRDSGVLASLESKDIQLDWLAMPDADSARADLPDDEAVLADGFEALARRSSSIAHCVTEMLMQAAEKQRVRLPSRDEGELSDSVLRALGGVSIGIEATLPRPLRRSGSASFRLEQTPEGVIGQWEESEVAPLDLLSLIRSRAGLLADLDGEIADLLAYVVCMALFEADSGDMILPRFRVGESTKSNVWLTWKRSSISDELQSLQ